MLFWAAGGLLRPTRGRAIISTLLNQRPWLGVRADGQGEIALGALQASLDVDYGPDEIGFTWAGFDEMDEVSGSGSAELQADGTLRIEVEYHLGDEAVHKAVP